MSTPSNPGSGPGTSGVTDAPTDRLGQVLDTVTYVLAATGLFVTVSAVATLAVGGRVAPGVKYGLFVFGWLGLGAATVLLLPDRPWRDGDEGFSVFGEFAEDSQSAFQRFVQRLPPARFRPVEPDDRFATGVRMLLAALTMLGTSLVMEQVFGIGP
ncbi:DUF7555 family protein [Halobacterium litoreum]|uniref:Integral membrane protein n=1 Tax=Halobacterium litoreum TaxID=2039234 RepID=A0ABD5NEW5_9EURY|nr:hypothetical protein [Halobacterium litoreum]UHH13374.1 hypothetical protein LT972_14600 [Halobacterium litoreum]